jgi:hypothetical protein
VEHYLMVHAREGHVPDVIHILEAIATATEALLVAFLKGNIVQLRVEL